MTLCAHAAYLRNVPRQLLQPNGDTLHCFISGDEFHHWLHDADNYTIVQNPSTGYFVYALLQNDELIPSPFVAGMVNPSDVGLQPNVNISSAKWQEKRNVFFKDVPKRPIARDYEMNHGQFNNIVVFIRFANDDNFTESFSSVEAMFNDSLEDNTSLYNYFKYTSYDQLHITSYFYPAPNGELILSFQDSFPRAYYEIMSETNPIGYCDTTNERTVREHNLLQRAIEYVSSMIPASLNLDYNEDGNVDNVCFVIKGSVGDWANLLWPHRWALYYNETFIHGKRVWDYNFQLSSGGYFSPSVLCHEMFHSLSAPDLYHYNDSTDMNPVGAWDLMASNGNPPQQMSSYMKYKYGNWIDDIPEITEPGVYTIYPLSSTTSYKTCYRMPTQSENEFILIEYRKKTTPFDSSVPGSGIVFARINTLFTGNASYNGSDVLDEVYVFRQNGSLTSNGSINYAYFKANSARDEFNLQSNPSPFLSNGDPIPISIQILTTTSDSIQFEVIQNYVDVENVVLSDWAKLYPNPAPQFFTIEVKDDILPCSLSIVDLTGKVMLQQVVATSQELVPLDNISSGIYFVRLVASNNEVQTIKIIKP